MSYKLCQIHLNAKFLEILNYTESILMLSSWKSNFNIFPLTVILAHSLLELWSVICHHPIWFLHHQSDMTITVNHAPFITDPCKY